MKMQNSALAMGAILRVWWPLDEAPTVVGPKFRPAIFLGETVINGTVHWVVAYGTTVMKGYKQAKNGGDLFVQCMEDRGVVINSDTRFDFNRVEAFPATTEYFSSSSVQAIAKTAQIPAHLLEQAAICMHNANVGAKLQRLGVRL